MLQKPAHVKGLRAVAGGQLHHVIGQPHHGEITDDLAARRQHRAQGHAANGGHPVGHDPVQPVNGIRPADPVFAEIVDLVDAHRLPHSTAFRAHDVKGVGPAERRSFMARRAFGGEIVDMFHAIALPENGALGVP